MFHVSYHVSRDQEKKKSVTWSMLKPGVAIRSASNAAESAALSKLMLAAAGDEPGERCPVAAMAKPVVLAAVPLLLSSRENIEFQHNTKQPGAKEGEAWYNILPSAVTRERRQEKGGGSTMPGL